MRTRNLLAGGFLAALLVGCTGSPTEGQDIHYVFAVLRGSVVTEAGQPVPGVRIDVLSFRGECGPVEDAGTFLPLESGEDGSFEELLSIELSAPFEACLEIVGTPEPGSGLGIGRSTNILLDFGLDPSAADTTDVKLVLPTAGG